MPSAESLIAFVLAAAVFAYVPGPSMLYAAAQTLARGKTAGWLAALGLHFGGYVHVIAAAFGVAVIFVMFPALVIVVKLAGAMWLLWIGFQMAVERSDPVSADVAPVDKTERRVFCESMTVEILNPKTALFYLAFLPQFSDPAASLPVWTQLLILGTVVNIMFSSADVVCVLLASRVVQMAGKNRSVLRLASIGGGCVLIALGLHLAVTQVTL